MRLLLLKSNCLKIKAFVPHQEIFQGIAENFYLSIGHHNSRLYNICLQISIFGPLNLGLLILTCKLAWQPRSHLCYGPGFSEPNKKLVYLFSAMCKYKIVDKYMIQLILQKQIIAGEIIVRCFDFASQTNVTFLRAMGK